MRLKRHPLRNPLWNGQLALGQWGGTKVLVLVFMSGPRHQPGRTQSRRHNLGIVDGGVARSPQDLPQRLRQRRDPERLAQHGPDGIGILCRVRASGPAGQVAVSRLAGLRKP